LNCREKVDETTGPSRRLSPAQPVPSSPAVTANEPKHIAVCICTYRRPLFLKRLLKELDHQETGDLFTYSIVVADNDQSESAKNVVDEFAAKTHISVRYCVEPRQNIALTRNKAIENARGDFIAFIDDDEFPAERWLLTLFQACGQYQVDGVLGPVKRHFDEQPPQWVIKGNFYERATYPTGFVIDWRKGRTGNVLLKSHLFPEDEQPFRPEFRNGEDQDFFRRMIEKGHRFIWCNQAVAYEVVPPIRWKRSFMLRRALLRGAMEPQTRGFGLRDIAKSAIAVPAYVAVLPFAAVAGHHKFMKLLVSLCDHLGKLLAVVGINPIRDQYVTD
jgi:glycosyltransferase involved in cell wall biosynthesis